MRNGRSKCAEPKGRPCKGGRKGNKNKRKGCSVKQGRPCTARSSKKNKSEFGGKK